MFSMLKARILIDFAYYKLMDDLITFEGIWYCNEAEFEGKLFFAHLL